MDEQLHQQVLGMLPSPTKLAHRVLQRRKAGESFFMEGHHGYDFKIIIKSRHKPHMDQICVCALFHIHALATIDWQDCEEHPVATRCSTLQTPSSSPASKTFARDCFLEPFESQFESAPCLSNAGQKITKLPCFRSALLYAKAAIMSA